VTARTPYDREVLLEHVDQYSSRHGTIELELDRQRWRVTLASAEAQACTECHHQLDNLTYWFGDNRLCGRCARRGPLRAGDRDWARSFWKQAG